MTRHLRPPLDHTRQRRRWIVSAWAGTAGLLLQPGFAHAASDPATVPEPKRTKAGRYVMAADVRAFIQAQGGAGKVLFLDLLTRAEAMYLGMATGIDALVPFVEHQELMTDWDVQRGIYRLEPLQDFVPEVNRRLAQKGLAKSDVVVLICRSGDRSSRRRGCSLRQATRGKAPSRATRRHGADPHQAVEHQRKPCQGMCRSNSRSTARTGKRCSNTLPTAVSTSCHDLCRCSLRH